MLETGVQILGCAENEARMSGPTDDISFERKAYIDGVTYILKGLPRDMDEHERQSLRTAAPAGLFVEVVSPEDSLFMGSSMLEGEYYAANDATLTQKAVQALVVYFFMAVAIILPYLICWAKYFYKMEKKYEISKGLAKQGFMVASVVGRGGLKLGNRVVFNMGDKRAAQALAGLANDVARGAIGGTAQGITILRNML